MREPDFIIGNGYLRRWWIIPRNPVFNIYLHEFLGSDDDRALHDHPWFNISIVLKGWYVEHGAKCQRTRHAGAVVFRSPWSLHRLEVPEPSCWTLFITGPRLRIWGFACSAGWRPWFKFVNMGNPGQIGPGCD